MAEPIRGRCACGAIQFECSAEPLIAFNCHCRDCQKATGGAFVTAVAVPAAAVKITGQPKYYSMNGESGNTMSRGFCPECGVPLFAQTSAHREALGISAGCLDDPGRYQPTADIWTSSAQKWDYMNSALQKLPKGFPS
ncbi:MAG TPA: GFA family protein [Candidatus Binataceae bacterium]|nr:GFA family protein [Candidatus Binataceae bacterium]